MLLSELYKIMANKVTFLDFRGGDRPNHPPLDSPLSVTDVLECQNTLMQASFPRSTKLRGLLEYVYVDLWE